VWRREDPRRSVRAGREEPTAGFPGEIRVEGALESADPDGGAGGKALTRERGQVVGVGLADLTGDVDRVAAQRRGARLRRPFGERGLVAGDDVAAPTELDVAAEVLAAAQPREDQVRRPIDAAVGEGELQLGIDLAEGNGPDQDRHRHHLAAAGRLRIRRASRIQRADGCRLLGLLVRVAKLADRVAALRGVVELASHRREVLRRPGGGEAVRGRGLRRWCRPGDHSGDQRDQGDDRKRECAGDEPATPLHLRGKRSHGCGKVSD
jgi:hypothetical protein